MWLLLGNITVSRIVSLVIRSSIREATSAIFANQSSSLANLSSLANHVRHASYWGRYVILWWFILFLPRLLVINLPGWLREAQCVGCWRNLAIWVVIICPDSCNSWMRRVIASPTPGTLLSVSISAMWKY